MRKWNLDKNWKNAGSWNRSEEGGAYQNDVVLVKAKKIKKRELLRLGIEMSSEALGSKRSRFGAPPLGFADGGCTIPMRWFPPSPSLIRWLNSNLPPFFF